MKKLIFLFSFFVCLTLGNHSIVSGQVSDTFFFSENSGRFILDNKHLLTSYYSPTYYKYFHPRVMVGRHYFSGVQEIIPKYSIWEEDGYLSISEENMINIDHLEYYSNKTLDRIYFLSDQKNLLLFKYIGDNEKMRKFCLEVFKEDGIWFIYSKELFDDTMYLEQGDRVILTTWHKTY